MSLREIAMVSRALATEYEDRVYFDGIAASRGDSSSVELLVSIRTSDGATTTAMLLVSRAARADFEHELRRRLAALVSTQAAGG